MAIGFDPAVTSRIGTDYMNDITFITDRQIYESVILDAVPRAKRFLWIATADLKDLYVKKGRKMVPFLELLSDLAGAGVSIRLLHAKEPGPAFMKDFDRYPQLLDGMERICCPRVHFKSVVVDATFAYSGSANLTGAGMGARSANRRNFESGFITSDEALISQIMEQFDALWMGQHCVTCGRKEFCTDCQELL